MPDFKVGDRIKVLYTVDSSFDKGDLGVVTEILTDLLLWIKFNTHGKYYVINPNQIELIEEI